MSFIQKLKEYLIKDKEGYLLNSNNNGKVIMISGVWGSGKTFFWKNEIEKNLKESNIYISLYGKDSIDTIQQELFLKVYNFSKKKPGVDEIVSKTYSVFSFLGKSISAFGVNGEQLFKSIDTFKESYKKNKALEALSTKKLIICFDDFERKSTKIDLNDLFGFITQLASEFECKVVVILNEDLFKDKDAEVFSRVKEKTVNKFIEFKPTIEDLFTTIYKSNKKYKKIDKFKDTILFTIKEINELNARTYFQILDNSLEYYNQNNDIENKHIRTLSIATALFTNHNIVFYPTPIININVEMLRFELFTSFPRNIKEIVFQQFINSTGNMYENKDQLLEAIIQEYTNRKAKQGHGTEAVSTPDGLIQSDINFILVNKNLLWLIYFYGFKINFRKDIKDEELIQINKFIEHVLFPYNVY
ncbi:MAG TPA: P-loop NTPase fold protein [bacterium]|nr:P-loop NTPase fold protein [bacterium]HPN45830.1 P-loop NTPase fold protein [bacterium]